MQVVWVVCEPPLLKGLKLPGNLAKKLVSCTRIHLDTNLEARLELILQPYDFICKDQKEVGVMMKSIDSFLGKREEEEWGDVEGRT